MMSSSLGLWARLFGSSAIVSLLVSGAVAQDAQKRVAVMLAPTQDAFVGTWASSFQAAAEERGMQVSIFSSPYDAALQTRQIDDAIGQGLDALVVQPLSTN